MTTQWRLVFDAARGGTAQPQALQELCSGYWYPLYAYIRRRGHAPADACDLTQEFFARLLEKNWLANIDAGGGKFRSFLLTAVNRFLANEHDRTRAQKRGGGVLIVSLDEHEAEGRYRAEMATEETPERAFDRRWAAALLTRALERLRQDAAATGRERQFAALSRFLSAEPAPGDYAGVGAELGLSVGALATAVHRLRARYREVVREEIAATVLRLDEVEGELRYLSQLLAG